MRRISTSNRQLNKFGAGKDGFQNGDPATSTDATYLEADWFDAVQEEISSVIEHAGLAIPGASNTQLLAALNLLFGSPQVSVITGTKYLIATTNAAESGSLMLQGGWQWDAPAHGGAGFLVTMPAAFSDANYIVLSCDTGGGFHTHTCSPETAAQFRSWHGVPGPSYLTGSYNWLAIGRHA